MPSFSQFLFGKPAEEKRFQRYTPEQESALNQLLQQGLQGADFGGIEDIARKRFQEETVPTLAERFTSMGAGGQRSSAFESALGRAGSDLESQLAGLRGQFGMQQLGMGLQPRFESAYMPSQPGMAQGGLQALMQILPMLLKSL